MEADVTTPLCHRTIAADVVRIDTIGDDPAAWFDHEPRACVGSKCALWVPSVLSILRDWDDERGEDLPRDQWEWGNPTPYDPKNDNIGPEGGSRLATVGQCADNLRCEPWPDPSAGEGGG